MLNIRNFGLKLLGIIDKKLLFYVLEYDFD